MKTHELKLNTFFFEDVYNNRKEFEVRKNDRNYKVGDRLKLIDHSSNRPRFIYKEVKYILEGGQYGIEKEFVVLGLKDFTYPRKGKKFTCKIAIGRSPAGYLLLPLLFFGCGKNGFGITILGFYFGFKW